MFISQLPPESATATVIRLEAAKNPLPPDITPSQHDPETEQWSRLENLVAMVRDELVIFRWVWSQSKSKRKLKWKPEPLPRPGVKKRKPPKTRKGFNMLAQYMQKMMGDEKTDYS